MSDLFLLVYAYNAAQASPDPSTQNGAVIARGGKILTYSCNRFPSRVENKQERWETREDKYLYVNHAERRAITLAARRGISTENATMYCPFAVCCVCAQQVIDAGITRLYTDHRLVEIMPDRWKKECDTGLSMLREAGVQVDWNYDSLDLDFTILFNGQLWTP